MSPAAASPPDAGGAQVARAWQVLAQVQDPEIPVISVVDLGIVRHVELRERTLRVGIAPTYSGCPATAVIHAAVRSALLAAGYAEVAIDEVLSPPWTSDWISAEGRQRLAHYGIAPPSTAVSSVRGLWQAPAAVRCPRCASADTEETSHFGSTPCKALYRCKACLEPFEYFKCI